MEVKKVNYTVRGIPENEYEELKKDAEKNNRSINQEILHRISQGKEGK